MTQEDMERYAANWAANWNARDLDAILAHFAQDARFISPFRAPVPHRTAPAWAALPYQEGEGRDGIEIEIGPSLPAQLVARRTSSL